MLSKEMKTLSLLPKVAGMTYRNNGERGFLTIDVDCSLHKRHDNAKRGKQRRVKPPHKQFR